MGTTLHLDKLKEIYKGNNHPPSSPVNPVLPFVTKNSIELKNGFDELVGEYVRQICGIKILPQQIKEDELEFENPLVLQISSQIEYSPDAQEDLERFLRQYLFGTNHSMNVFHPYIYNYLPIPEKEGLKKCATFISDVLVEGDLDVAGIFREKNADDLLTELILENLNVVSVNQRTKGKHQNLLPFLTTLYREDLLYMNKYRDYFLSHFSLLTHFYTFMYMCQLLFKFGRFFKGDYSQANPFYFALEWEPLSKRRRSTEELGYKAIKDKLPNLFVHVHTLTQLSMLSSEEYQPFLTYSELDSQLTNESDRNDFLISLNQWIQEYAKNFKLTETIEEFGGLEEAIKGLFQSIEKGVNQEAAVKYGKNIPGFGTKSFIKSRSSLGQVFNMSQEMLLLLTAVCVKEERIPLNKLFVEFNKRGVDFDRLSKKAIIELFDTLNILDKKSDSGDAQYVKPILQ